jgi:acetylornithine deacetylase/succinyl-diaminopimelate desuccinylase-like protein
MYLNNVWRANLSITGADGLPDISKAGNVLRASTTVRLSLRLSPVFDCDKALELMKQKLTTDVPFNAKVTILGTNGGNGFCMKEPSKWLEDALQGAAQAFFDKPAGSYGDDGSIPFLSELGNKYPDTQIIALGVGGPFSNMHAPNEMLELTFVKKLTCSLAHIL